MDKELYFEMLEKKDEEIQELKGDIYLLEEELGKMRIEVTKIFNITEVLIK